MTKIVVCFPLEAMSTVAPDGLPRASVAVPVGAKILHLGTALPSDIIAVFALCDPPVSPAPGEPPTFKEMTRMEFIVAGPGTAVPNEYLFRAPVKTKLPPEKEGDPPREGLIFLFEKQAPKLMILTPGGKG